MDTRKIPRSEEGQALIQFAMMFIVLLMFVALVIEAANVYAVRRQMQNAADAGALAAARELCLNNGEQAAITKANDYLRRNGMNSDDVALSTVTVNGHQVSVTARTNAFLTLARAVGWGGETGTIEVGATARAACGAANSACALWPLAIDGVLFENAPCGESIIIWDANGDGDEALCKINGVERPLNECYTCQGCSDPDNFTIVTSVARGWMDFPAPPEEEQIYVDSCKSNGCGASELFCRLFYGYGGRVTLPTCIPGLRGVKANAKAAVEEHVGNSISVPLFTDINCPSDSNCSGKDAATYYVTEIGCIKVVGWIQTFRLNPRPNMPSSVKRITSKAIEAIKDCDGNCFTACGSTTGEAPKPGETTAVGLVR